MKISLLTIALLLVAAILGAQALPIAIDSQFDDWSATTYFTDTPGDDNDLDLLQFDVANDENFLFLRLTLAKEIILTNDNDLSLFLDTDSNPLTGKMVNGIGAELELNFGERKSRFYYANSSSFSNLNSLKFHHQPTLSSKVFEIALSRQTVISGVPLFTGNAIRIFFRNGSTGDMMPDEGLVFTYNFDNTATLPFQPVDLQKDKPQAIRLLTWNTLQDGLADFTRREHFKRVISVLQPDLITFNECWNVTAGMAATLLNEALPLADFQSWNAVKLDAGNITVSRFPILQNWLVHPGSRLTASLIDLPGDTFQTDLLLINGHLKCCDDGNSTRQLEADAFAAFILDAKTPGGAITLPEGTPFVLSGDLNLVGWQQQLTTLLTGDIVNTGVFGLGGALDWDGSSLLDVIALQADRRMAHTWYSNSSSYPPSRLDYHICSSSVMQVDKAFSLQTEIMPPGRLAQYGLEANDTHSASDHLPRVTDFLLNQSVATAGRSRTNPRLEVFPNPAMDELQIRFATEHALPLQCRLLQADGRVVCSWQQDGKAGLQERKLALGNLPPGVYFLNIQTEKGSIVKKVVKQ